MTLSVSLSPFGIVMDAQGAFYLWSIKVIIEINNYKVLIDDEDYDKISKYKWTTSSKRGERIYFETKKSKNYKLIYIFYLHRFILNYKDAGVVDHINGNTLDNRKINLRICSIAENGRNRKINKNNTSGYKGVYFNKIIGKYEATISLNKKKIHLGFYNNPQEAYIKYCDAAIKYHGEFARVL